MDSQRSWHTALEAGLDEGLAWSPDDQWIASGGPEGTLRIWSIGGEGECREFRVHDGRVGFVRWSPDQDTPRVATASQDVSVRIWDAITFRRLADLTTELLLEKRVLSLGVLKPGA